MNQSKSCECVKSLFFVEFESQDEVSICVVNEYLLSGLLSHTARHTHLNSCSTKGISEQSLQSRALDLQISRSES